MRQAAIGLAWLSAVIAVVGFLQPWAHLDVKEIPLKGLDKRLGRVTVMLKQGVPQQVSGIQIPRMANREEAKLAAALMELVTKKRQDVGLKSYAVYLMPGLALLGALVLTAFGHRTPAALGVLAAASLVAGVGFWKLLTIDTNTLLIAITIGRGLWWSLWAYVGLAAAAGLAIMPHTFRRVSSGSRAEA